MPTHKTTHNRGAGLLKQGARPDFAHEARALLGATNRLPTEVTTAIHNGWTASPWDQGETESCVGHALARAILMAALRDRLKVADRNPDVMLLAEPEPPSRRAIYTLARVWDRKGKDDELLDEGSSPWAALRAMRDLGVPHERAFPWEAERVNEEVDLQLALDSWEHKVAQTGLIVASQGHVGDEVALALSRGYFPCIDLDVDAGLDNHLGILPLGPAQGAVRGSHYVVCVGYETQRGGDRVYWILNSWGASWGRQGLGLLHASRVEQCELACIVKTAPRSWDAVRP